MKVVADIWMSPAGSSPPDPDDGVRRPSDSGRGYPLEASSQEVAVDEPAEKAGLRNAWSRVAEAYETSGPSGPPGSAPGDSTCSRRPPGRRRLTWPAAPDSRPSRWLSGSGAAASSALTSPRPWWSGPRPGSATSRGCSFAVDDAEHLSLPEGSADVVSCTFGLMYCYDARAAMASAARTLRPGGRMLQVVWGPAPRVWWVPVIELIETRAQYFSAVCPMMFFYGLPGVMPRMIQEAGLEAAEIVTVDDPMRFADVDEAVDAAIHAFPLAGLYASRLTRRRRPRSGASWPPTSSGSPNPTRGAWRCPRRP